MRCIQQTCQKRLHLSGLAQASSVRLWLSCFSGGRKLDRESCYGVRDHSALHPVKPCALRAWLVLALKLFPLGLHKLRHLKPNPQTCPCMPSHGTPIHPKQLLGFSRGLLKLRVSRFRLRRLMLEFDGQRCSFGGIGPVTGGTQNTVTCQVVKGLPGALPVSPTLHLNQLHRA